jgi:flagellar biosynthesis anti-sigma factor FlgM
MNIHKIDVSSVSKIYNKKYSDEQKINASKPAAKDDIVLSESGKIFNQALRAVKDQPEIRVEKVRELSAQVKAGKYQVSDDALAEAIMKNTFFIK